MASQIISYNYDRASVKAGILHFGVGNFHRAHQEYYTNLLLADSKNHSWGICGAMILPNDERLYNALKGQNLEFTLTVCGRDGKDSAYNIGSLVELYFGIKESGAIIDKIASSDIKIITLTITEGGYNIIKETGEFDLNNELIKHDIANPGAPKTAFGYIAAGLRARIKNNSGPITILSCDNLQHNGHTAERAFNAFFNAQDKELAAWAKDNITFPNSMVDRITPVTLPEDITRLNAKNGTNDNAPVYCEDFIQWVIEDDFIAGRPAWDKVGAQFTKDVSAFENMKLSLLNASHTLLSYPSFLSGYRKVDDAMTDKRITKFIKDFMDIDITPYVPAPEDTDLELYKKTLIERFGNKSVSDQVARLAFDGFSKFPVYVIPNLIKMIKDNKDLSRVAYLIASYRHYLKYKKDDNGASFEIAEPWMNPKDQNLIDSDNALDFLGISAFSATNLKDSTNFTNLYLKLVDDIKANGAMKTLESII